MNLEGKDRRRPPYIPFFHAVQKVPYTFVQTISRFLPGEGEFVFLDLGFASIFKIDIEKRAIREEGRRGKRGRAVLSFCPPPPSLVVSMQKNDEGEGGDLDTRKICAIKPCEASQFSSS